MAKKGTVAQRQSAPYYAIVYADLRLIAKEHGYALAIHGSLARDLDVVAVPWTEDAAEPKELLAAFERRLGIDYSFGPDETISKPHGRLTYIFHLSKELYGDGAYIDLSVMPKKK